MPIVRRDRQGCNIYRYPTVERFTEDKANAARMAAIFVAFRDACDQILADTFERIRRER